MPSNDLRMDEMDGTELLSQIRSQELGCPVVFITAYATLETAVEALRLGAADFLVKPFEEKDVLLAVERALGVQRILSENIRLRQHLSSEKKVRPGVFASKAMLQIRDLAQKVAASEATVLISGESGTGKEVMARFIHDHSPRSRERFVAMNCAAIAPNLLEAELFGHEKGAFTGADKARAGKFEFATGGTLFLDEIGEMPLEAQVKLLRTIQEKSVQRVGGNHEIAVNCRLICATHRDLPVLVQQGAFREDLYYRLAVFPLHMPPLRERRDDIAPLLEHCLLKLGQRPTADDFITPAALQLLQNYHWPGNVRELFNLVERALILKGSRWPLNSDDFPQLGTPTTQTDHVPVVLSETSFTLPPAGIDYEELQRHIVAQSLEMTQGNQSAAARLLGVSRARFRTLLALLENPPQEQRRAVIIHVRRRQQQP